MKRWADRVRASACLCLLPACVLATEAQQTLDLRVAPGDTLIGIGQRYLEPPARWRELARLNRVRSPRHLQPGTVLRIPLDWVRWSPLEAEVVHVHGVVQGDRGPLAAGMRLAQGARWDTGADGFLTLRLPDGSLVRFAPQTRAGLGVARQAPLGGVRATRIELDQGGVEATVPPQDAPATRFEVRTPRVVTAVRGTRFRVAQEPQASHHEVLEGSVTAQGAGPAVAEIASGSGLRAQDGQLGAIVPLLPAPDLSTIPALVERSTQQLQVAPLPGAAGWRWQVAADAEFVQPLRDAGTRAPQWLLAGLPDGNYFLRVRAADAQGLEGQDTQRAVVLRARPEPPMLLAPRAGASVSDVVPLAWTRADGAARYHLQVARDAAFTDLVRDQAGIAVERITLEPALAAGSYHWRLASQRPDGSDGPFGDPAGFRVLEPSQMQPPQRDAAGWQLRWSGPTAMQVQVQVATTDDFSAPVLEREVGGSSLTLPDPAPGSYRARTRTVLPDGGYGPWSATQRFEVPAPPPAAPDPSRPWYLLLILLLPLL